MSLIGVIGAARRRRVIGLDPNPPEHGWSVRRLRSGYAGNCLQIRRSSDNATQNIGFSSDWIDEAAIASFVGAGSGFVTIWYDQGTSGGWDLSQAVGSSQPRLVNAGTLEVSGGLAALNSFQLNRWMINGAVNGGGATSHFHAFAGTLTSGSNGRIFAFALTNDYDSINGWLPSFRATATAVRNMQTTQTAEISYTEGNRMVLQSRVAVNLLGIRRNGESEVTNASSRTPNLTYNRIGMRIGLGNGGQLSESSTGFTHEQLVYMTDPGSTIRDFVRDNQNTAFAVY
jgi:hypothetical protein